MNINKVFDEKQIFRIDHYLGKETVQNVLVFRFRQRHLRERCGTGILLTMLRSRLLRAIGIEDRGPFYEKAGTAARCGAEPCNGTAVALWRWSRRFRSRRMRCGGEKVKVWKRDQADPDRGYGAWAVWCGGRFRKRVPVQGLSRRKIASNPKSVTETFVAIKLEIENWRWAGVPFYIRAGKRMAKRLTEVTVQFKQPPLRLFKNKEGSAEHIEPNFISMRIQPDDGITLRFGAKKPGPQMDISAVDMDFSYADAFGPSSNNGYERLLLDAMLGDATLFAHRDGVEATWTLMTPVLENWAKNPVSDFPNYPAGTWGPAASDAMLKADGRKWRKL